MQIRALQNHIATKNENYTENNFAAKIHIQKIASWCGMVVFYDKTNEFAHVPRNHIHIKTRNDDIHTTEIIWLRKTEVIQLRTSEGTLYSYEKRKNIQLSKTEQYIATKNGKPIATKNGKIYSYERRKNNGYNQTEQIYSYEELKFI